MGGLETVREEAEKYVGDQFHMMLLPNIKHIKKQNPTKSK